MIRAATVEDAAQVAEIYIGSRKRHVAFAPLVHSDAEIHCWVQQVLIPRSRVLVVEEAGRIVAMMAVSKTDEGSWIDQLYVHPDMTSRGLGAALMEEAKQELPQPILLYTFQQNQRSRRFYERQGFVAVSFSDGNQNEERCPDVLYRWEQKRPKGTAPNGGPATPHGNSGATEGPPSVS